MRTIALLAGAALALGLVLSPSADARSVDARIWVSLGDVVFMAGVPHHRHHRQPLQVVSGRHGPRYYYHAAAPHYSYPAPVRAHGHRNHHYDARYYAPPPPRPPRPGYHRYRPGY